MTQVQISPVLQSLLMQETLRKQSVCLMLEITSKNSLNVGTLKPLNSKVLTDEFLIAQICEWRNDNLRFFFTQNRSTVESTKQYIRRVLKDSRYSMFLMYSTNGEAVGHLGYAERSKTTVELDNLVRGNMPLPADFIEAAERCLISEIFIDPAIEKVQLQVLSNNVLAKRIHFLLGFEITDQYPLKRTIANSVEIKLSRANEGDQYAGYAQTLTLTRNSFTRNT